MSTLTELKAEQLRATFEATVLRWPEVSTKKMFGAPCYLANGKLFAFFVTDALVLTKLTEVERDTVAGEFVAEPFTSGTRTIQSWLRISLDDNDSLNRLVPYITSSYETALDESFAESQ